MGLVMFQGWGRGEDTTRFNSVEGARFGDWVEDLGSGQGVGGKVVDGFMIFLALAWFCESGGGNHLMDGPSIW